MTHWHRSNAGLNTSCIALIDARFWWWIQDRPDDEVQGLPSDLFDQLQGFLHHAGGPQLQRIYWYTDETVKAAAPGVVLRPVPPQRQDGGVGMLRAMAHDLVQAAQRRSADRVLVVSDDERLLLAVDEAQSHGIAVDMLIDEQAQHTGRLQEDDPSWSRLLTCADRQVVWGAAGARVSAAGTVHGLGSAPAYREPRSQRDAREFRHGPSPEAAQIIDGEIDAWWQEESDVQRDHWRLEVQAARGIPQELDRQLLLRVSRRLGQALSPAEKTTMRLQVRQRVLHGMNHMELLSRPEVLQVLTEWLC